MIDLVIKNDNQNKKDFQRNFGINLRGKFFLMLTEREMNLLSNKTKCMQIFTVGDNEVEKIMNRSPVDTFRDSMKTQINRADEQEEIHESIFFQI